MIKKLVRKLRTAEEMRREGNTKDVLLAFYMGYIRDLLPKTNITVKKGGVPVIMFDVPILDPLLGIVTDEPEYEYNYINCLEPIIEAGMDVVVVGGGWGVSATIAGQQVGTEGSVVVYEASESEVRKTKRTVELNEISRQTQVIHAIIGESIKLRGNKETQDAKSVPIDDLPAHDILLIDCDGCELHILNNLSKLRQLPDKVVVEHHGIKDEVEYDPTSIIEKLRNHNYTITNTSTEKFMQANREDPRETIIVGELE